MEKPFSVLENKHGAVMCGTSGVRHAKQVVIRRNFVKEHVEKGNIAIEYCPALSMVTDILTKPLGRQSFENHRMGLDVHRIA